MEHLGRERESRLEHSLNPLFGEIRRFKTRAQYESSALYRKHGAEIERVVNGVEWHNGRHAGAPRQIIRALAWNVERGKNLDGVIHLLQNHPVASRADVLLLTETDIGMGRSGNRNVPREVAAALDMNYVYANSYLVFDKGDIGEQDHQLPNTLSLHGTAILSRFRIESYKVEPLPRIRDAFYSGEKRLGQRKTLICRMLIEGRRCDFAATHLDFNSSVRQRARQMRSAMEALEDSAAAAQLIGGDWNTSTYNLYSKLDLVKSFMFKFIFLGFSLSIEHYMKPEVYFEKPVFDVLRDYGFNFETYNDKSRGTLYYDLENLVVSAKTRQYIPALALHWLRRKLRPWKGSVPLRLDWMAGWGFEAVQKPRGPYVPPQIIERPRWRGELISDHNPIVADLVLPQVREAAA